MSSPRVTSQTLCYRERLWVPWWWWAIGIGLSAVLATTVSMGVRALPPWIPYMVLAGAATGVLLWLSRAEVRVISTDGDVELWAGQAHLPAAVVTKSAPIPRTAKSAALGRQLDPAAFVMHRPWIGPMTLVVLADPDDPTPYWLVSSRHPERVLSALHT